ncbi:putative glycoside hydrolase [Nocardia sp. NPDC049190]|uniref:putative glycoside hydrolase n=1 Tax=Nocardia sp. NPDC049190 TaxID=3155650 RepID=UPI0033C94334
MAVGAVLAILISSMIINAGRAQPSGLPLHGLPQHLVSTTALATLELRVDARGHDPHTVRLTLDGTPVDGEVDGDTVVYRPRGLRDGTHAFLAVIQPGGPLGFFRKAVGASATFTVDTEPPKLDLEQPRTATSYQEAVTVRGNTIDAEQVSLGGQSVRPDSSGRFEITVPRAPVGADVVAVDAAGNVTTRIVSAGVDLPRTKAVHMTAYAWAYDPMREAVLALARQGRINTVELDIKDEDGIVGYDSQVVLARESGAVGAIYDAGEAIRRLHDLGLKVVGRIVAFRDPTMGAWAWRTGRQDWVTQNPSGQPYSSGYGPIAFTNFAHPEIREYNIALAVEAARLGFDGIMYDYVRRPDGDLSGMRFPGLTDTPSASIVEFLRQSRDPVHDAGAHLGAAVFGIAATRPDQIAQDIPAMARNVDVVAPMLYPSHWHSGEYGVPNPNAQPYDIIIRSLQDFRARTEGTGSQIMPWLQDFSLGVPYNDAEVRAQVDATHAAGLDSFFLWSPTVKYHGGAINPE